MVPANDPKLLEAIDLELQQVDPSYAALRRSPRPDQDIVDVFKPTGIANPFSDFTDHDQEGQLGLYRNQVKSKSQGVWKAGMQTLAQE
mmetsp:Transcript_9337/g.26789  ORF Transcript_9337/g.26789 Transcript_9337/m.26789 type:complete len:88 (-) Transcript_9337:192-455(-)